MSKLPSAREFAIGRELYKFKPRALDLIEMALIKFAKMHVKAALLEVNKNVKLIPRNSIEVQAKIAVSRNLQLEDMEIDRNSIMDAYPDKLIK